MPRRIYKCVSCGRYTLNRERCPSCGGEVRLAHPPRWSPADRFAKYRVKMRIDLKEKSQEKAGLLGAQKSEPSTK